MKRRIVAAFGLGLVLAFSAFAANLPPPKSSRVPEPTAPLQAGVLQKALVPTVFYVGDTVELYLRIARPAGTKPDSPIMLTEPQKLPSNDSVKVVSLTVTPREGYDEARIRFIPFEPGDISLPEIDAGPFRLPPVAVTVGSILEGRSATLVPIRGQLELPGTKLFLYGLAGLILLALLSVFLFVKYGLSFFAALIESYRENQPYKIMQRTLKKLRDELDSLDSASFYDVLLSSLRGYLGFRLRANCVSLTSSEIQRFFVERELDANLSARLSRIFSDGDLVKFASRPATRERKAEELDDVEAVLVSLETREAEHA